MTKVISITQQKGGCGKTTVATNLATALTTRQYKVLLVDADPQASAMDWASMNGEYTFPTIAIPTGDIGKQIMMMVMASDYDFVVVDSAPRLQSEMTSVLAISDLAILPCQPSPLDIWACDYLVDTIKARQNIIPNFKAYFLLNGTHPLSKIQGDVLDAMNEYGLPIFETSLAARTSYRRIMNEGKSVIFSDDEKAAGEITQLTKEILGVIHGNK